MTGWLGQGPEPVMSTMRNIVYSSSNILSDRRSSLSRGSFKAASWWGADGSRRGCLMTRPQAKDKGGPLLHPPTCCLASHPTTRNSMGTEQQHGDPEPREAGVWGFGGLYPRPTDPTPLGCSIPHALHWGTTGQLPCAQRSLANLSACPTFPWPCR